MARKNTEILELLLQIQGDEQVEALRQEFLDLARAGEVSESAIGGFVRELDQLAEASASANRLERLEKAIEGLGPELDQASKAALALKLQLGSVDEPTREMQKAFEAARREVDRLEQAQRSYGNEADRLRGTLERVGVNTRELGQAQDFLRRSADATVGEFRDLSAALASNAQRLREGDERFRRFAASSRTSAEALARYRANAATADAQQNKLNASAQRGVGVFDRLRGVLASVGVFLGLREAGQAVVGIASIGDAAEKTRIRLEALYGSQEEGNRAFERLREIADQNGQAFDSVTDAAAKLKSFGLDPLDGTLQALIDQNAKLGGSQENLEGAILAVGQAWAKEKLQGEEILQLVERGVPVWELLAKATGKNVTELQELSSKGLLGRDVIRQLLDEIGRSSDGAAARGLSTLSAQFQGLRNRAQEFLEEISNAGVLEFFKSQLAALNTEVRRLAADGTLAQYAKNVADGIVATAEAVKSAVVFVRDYSGALILLGKAYLAIKIAPFVAGMASSAQAMAAAALQARTLVPTLGGVRSALTSIPTNIKIGIGLVAADLLFSQLDRLTTAIKGYQETLRDTEAFEIEQNSLALDRKLLVDQLIEVYAKYADLQLKSNEQLAAAGEADLQLYQQRLAAAERYYAAVQARAKDSGDVEGLERARAKLAELREEQGRVVKAFDAIRDARRKALEDTQSEDALAAALKELKVSAQNLGVEFTEQGAKITEAFGTIALSAKATGAQIGEAFSNALNQTQTTAEVERLQNALEEAFRRGRISAEQFGVLMDAAREKVKGITSAAAEAAGSFDQIVKAGEEATRALIGTLEASRAQLAVQANRLAAEISRGLKAGLDTGPLRAQLGEVEGQINETTGKINAARSSLDGLSASSDNAAASLYGLGGAAASAGNAVQGVAQAADTSLGNIGNKTTQVVGGPLAGLNAAFAEARKRAEALGEEALRAFDATLRVGDQFKGSGFGMRETMDLLARRTQAAIDTAEDLERTYANTRDRVRETAEAFAELSRIQSLSLEQQRQANLEAEQAALETAEKKAAAQIAAAAGIERQVSASRELAAVRESSAPARVELIAKNEQKPGGLLSELSEADLRRLAQRVFAEVASDGRGVMGR